MKLSKPIAVSALTLFASGAFAGPFGIEMGADIDELDVAESGFKPSLNSVPDPHPLFTQYSVWHSSKTGVCRIMAFSKTWENDRYGEDVRSNFTRVQSALAKKYGDSEKIDFLKSGALWDETQDWVMAIRQNERVYATVWEYPSLDGEDAFSMIQFWVGAFSSSDSFFVLEYRSVDFDTCNEAIEAEQDSSF